jgi:serpin B
MKKICFILCVLAVLFASCKKEDSLSTKIDINPRSLAVIKADNTFGIKLFKQIIEESDTNKNLFISPTSVAIALAMTYNGARTDTKEAFEECLELDGLTTQDINEVYENLIEGLIGADPKVTFKVANSIW